MRLLGGRYLLEEQVAGGGMASVWRAHDEVLARTVAVKVLHDHLAADPGFRERFRREAVAAAKLTHPHIVSLYDTGREDDRVYLVLEYVEGATLAQVLAHHGALAPAVATALAQRVAGALDHAHERGLVHRDVKPANILLGADGLVKVTDFGIAKAEGDTSGLTRTGAVMGTAAYVAPEQIVGGDVDGKADQYALGCVLYEALAGRRPFEGASPVETAALRLEGDAAPLASVRPGLPPGLDAVVARMMARRREDRYPTAAQAAAALGPYADHNPDQLAALVAAATRHPSVDPPPGSVQERARPRWVTPVLGVVACVVLVVGIALASGFLRGEDIASLFAQEVLATTTPPVPATPTQPTAAAVAEAQTVTVARLITLDEAGDGENDDRLLALTDGDGDTAWETERYHSAAFGNLKDGVGFVVDLGESREVTAVILDVATPGVRYEVRAIQGDASEDAEDWALVGGEEDAAGGPVRTVFSEPVATRYLLVYVTGDLQPIDGRFSAAFSELAVEALP